MNQKFGNVAPHEHVELIPEDISESDIREFHENCLEMGIDLHRLDRVTQSVPIPDEERETLASFVRRHGGKSQSKLFDLKEKVKRKVINRTCFTAVLRKHKQSGQVGTFDLMKTHTDQAAKYHFVTDNNYERKLINEGESVKYDRNQNILTIPTTDEKFKVTWQNIYPNVINLKSGTHRGMIKWDRRPEQVKATKPSLQTSSLVKKTSEHNVEKDKEVEGPIIYLACRDWQNEWSIAQNWKQMTFHQIRFKLSSIQATDREEALFSLAMGVIEARMAQKTTDDQVQLPDGFEELVVGMLEDQVVRIRIIAAIIINSLPLAGYEEMVAQLLKSSLESSTEFPDRVLISIMSTLYDLDINHRICECLVRKYFIEPSRYILNLMKAVSNRSNLMHAVTSEYLNSRIWEERSGAATILGQLDQKHLTGVMIKKIVDLAWHDKNANVKKSSSAAIMRSIENEKVVELCHTKMLQDLENDDTILRGLDMVLQFNFISDQIFNLILKCFKNERGKIINQTVQSSYLSLRCDSSKGLRGN